MFERFNVINGHTRLHGRTLMAGSKRVAVLLVGILLVWAGLCQIGGQTPLAGSLRVYPGAGDDVARRVEIPAREEAQEIYSQVGQPMTILFVAPSGKAVRKGDLLVELDASPLVDRRIQQIFDTHKAESELILATDALEMEKRADTGQIELAEKALRLAQGQLKAFTEGEYPTQLAEAQAEAALAEQRSLMARDRYERLRHPGQQGNQDEQAAAELQLQEAYLALMEARLQGSAAANRLALLQKSVHDNKIAELELAVAQREYDLARAKDALSSATLRGKQAVALAEMSNQTESARLARLDDQIRKSRIYAPRDGTVVYPPDADEAATKPGATVYDRQVLLRLLPVTPAKP
jgi:HlyD family secretion protein